ncbi:3-oxoacyl-ACP reductase [Tessaracoccus lubricantis]|uniref:3-oxoacyl-ACP reductase n=1 Tax=Tessaracoccus lubricantis TaxID=545543 RepID=A0ABP9F8Z9_9ACTN
MAASTSPAVQKPAAPALADQVVVVTGGARGLGRSIVQAFLREGARVLINYRASAEAAEQLAAAHPGQAVAVQADVRDRAQVDALMSRAKEAFGAPVSTVVNNALVDFSFNGDARAKAGDIAYEDLGNQFSGVVEGALNVIQAALPSFERAGSGRVINIGTNLFQHPVVPYHDYTAAKAALLSLTRTFAVDLGPRGINVNMVSGGLLRTTDASAATPDAVFDAIAAGTPLGSVTTPDEFADAIIFFASPWARAITGQNLVVDGGLVKN